MISSDGADQHRVPVRMQVTTGRSDWDKPHPEQKITIDEVHARQQPDGSVDLTWTSHIRDLSGYKLPQLPLVNVLFRDSAGKLLGGAAYGLGRVPEWQTGTQPGGLRFTADQWKYGLPAGADLTRIEVYGALDGG
jgi:hypothetical protein